MYCEVSNLGRNKTSDKNITKDETGEAEIFSSDIGDVVI